MEPTNEMRKGRSCVFLMHAHLVFVTKYRKDIFSREVLEAMKRIFEKVCQDFNTSLVEFDGERDHVHLLINYPPKISLARLVNSLKGVSSRLLRKEYPALKPFYWNRALWSPSYFAGSCSGAPLSTIKQYIEQQDTPP